jgi:hypothetical protein
MSLLSGRRLDMFGENEPSQRVNPSVGKIERQSQGYPRDLVAAFKTTANRRRAALTMTATVPLFPLYACDPRLVME